MSMIANLAPAPGKRLAIAVGRTCNLPLLVSIAMMPLIARSSSRWVDHRVQRLILARAGRSHEDCDAEQRAGDPHRRIRLSLHHCVGRPKSVDLQVDRRGAAVGSCCLDVAEHDVDRPGSLGCSALADVVFDPRRDVGRLREAEPDQLSPCVARCQVGANAAVELLVEGDLVPRTVDSVNDRRRVQALEAGAVELDRRGVGRQRRAEWRRRRLVDLRG